MSAKYEGFFWVTLGFLATLSLRLHSPLGFCPVLGIGIFMVSQVKDSRLIFLSLIPAFLVADLSIGFYEPGIMVAVYLAVYLASSLGLCVGSNLRLGVLMGFLGTTLFYVTTNTAVWWVSGYYEYTFQGFLTSLYVGIPFYVKDLIANTLTLAGLLGVTNLISYLAESKPESVGV